ncbi:MAG: hypothetical protein ABI760_07410, partial [Ferruginibacter sp.]
EETRPGKNYQLSIINYQLSINSPSGAGLPSGAQLLLIPSNLDTIQNCNMQQSAPAPGKRLAPEKIINYQLSIIN